MSLLKKLNLLANSSKEKEKSKIASISVEKNSASVVSAPISAGLSALETLKISPVQASPVQVAAPISAPAPTNSGKPKLQITDFVIDRTLGTISQTRVIQKEPGHSEESI